MYQFNQQHILESLPEYVWITDKQHRYIAGSKKSADILGFPSLEKMIGSHLHDIPCGILHTDELCRQRNYVLESKNTIDVLDIHAVKGGEIQVHLAKRHPFFDDENELIGVIVTAREINHRLFAKLIYSLSRSLKKYQNDKNYQSGSYEIITKNAGKLSKREMECYFYLLRGYSARKISLFLNLSPRTVETHIENIKAKMFCANKSDLIDQGIASGVLYKLPFEQMKNLSIILNDPP